MKVGIAFGQIGACKALLTLISVQGLLLMSKKQFPNITVKTGAIVRTIKSLALVIDLSGNEIYFKEIQVITNGSRAKKHRKTKLKTE